MSRTYFFCGIGGSGMSALAAICLGRGIKVEGSDRSRDGGQSPDKFKKLQEMGIILHPQDGSGIGPQTEALIVSSAVEDSIPDVKAAKDRGVKIRKRADLLAELFNQSETPIAVAGTSGKTTVTGMIATILTEAGFDPAVMNGGIMLNFAGDSGAGLGNMRLGAGPFVAETDESDGSIALYNPAVAVVNNVAFDHKTIEELDSLFGDFISRSSRAVVLNFDDEKLRDLSKRAKVTVYSYSLTNLQAGICASDIHLAPDGVSFNVVSAGKVYPVKLKVPGAHNVANALAALSTADALGIPFGKAANALESFIGIKRRLEVTGSRNGITVIDDFAHNPDKIAATLKALKAFSGKLIVMFQPHGYGPLKLMGRQIADVFSTYLDNNDLILMPEAYYVGGTVDRSVTAQNVIDMIKASGIKAQWFEKRADIKPAILAEAKKGDRVVVMGARDDTLSDFAREIVASL